MRKGTSQKDAIKNITWESQANSYFPYRWSPASLTFNIYFYLYLYLYITRITINNGTPHLKSPKNQSRIAALGRPAIKLLGGFNWFAIDQPSPFVLLWFLRHLVVRFAWRIPSSQMHYRRNIEIRIKTKIKQTWGLTEKQHWKSGAKETHQLNPDRPDLRQPGMGVSHQPPVLPLC